jgi:hypothetical protein
MAGSKPTMSGQIILDYLAKYPAWMPSNTLATLILKENKNHFTDKENVRYLIRYYRGKTGADKKSFHNKEFLETTKRSCSQFVQPETWAEEKVVFNLPIGIKKMGFISDIQVPFHDPKAIDVCFDYLNKEGIDTLFINGDLVDFYQLSDFQKDPRVRKFNDEYESILEMLGFIRRSFPNLLFRFFTDGSGCSKVGAITLAIDSTSL